MSSTNQVNNGGPGKEHPDAALREKEEEMRKKREADRAKRLQVRKVSPAKKFFSSIRVKFFSVIIFFTLLAAVAISLTASYMILDFYESMDTLDMEERVQNAVIGLQRCGNSLQRGLGAGDAAFKALDDDNSLHYDVERGEEVMAQYVFSGFDEVNGRASYQNVPIQLLMVFDPEWNERLVYYRPCNDSESTEYCKLVDREDIFVNYKEGDYRMAHKGEVPSFFRTMKYHHPGSKCDHKSCIGIAADIPRDEGGPFFYLLGSPTCAFKHGGLYCSEPGQCQAWSTEASHPNWHYLVAFNMRELQQIIANRTGLCVSSFLANDEDLPDYVEEELKIKQDKDLVLNPHDYDDEYVKILQNSDQVTVDQEYYSIRNSKYKKYTTGREYCDPTYDHGGDETVSNSYAFFAYHGYDLPSAGLSDEQTYLIRFDYHDPLTAEMYPKVVIYIVCLVLVWLISIAGIIVYFNQVFLVPLDRMRKLRADFIKTILQGLDDDGVLAQEVFGDMLDDSALIEAGGDEISVMLTLQDRVDALYSKVITNRQSDLNRVRNHIARDNNALRLMRFFLRREDENLRAILPGLMDSNEMGRRFRRSNIDAADKTDAAQDLMTARNTFRTLKAILSSNIATEFFKMFCVQRGRSTVNSFFFLMDVSWLSQVESAARSENEDFLSALFAESIPQSPNGLTSPRPGALGDNKNLSSDLLVALDQSVSDMMPQSPEPEQRQHHSHFAKAPKGAAGKPKTPTAPSADAAGAGAGAGAGVSSGSVGSKGSKGSDDGKNNAAAEEAGKGGKKARPPPLAIGHDLPLSSPLASPRFNPLASPRFQRVQFLTKNGETIARFIHELYFGRKSLAQADLKHAALLGCSQVPDYVTLRDKSSVNYSPVMYNSLTSAITKKFAEDVIPQFLNSTTFQLMVYALMLSGYFEKAEKTNANNARKILLLIQQPEQEAVQENVNGVGYNNPLLRSVWTACKSTKKKVKSDDDDSSSSSSSDDDDDDDDDEEEEEDDKKKDDKKKKDDDADDKKKKEDSSDDDDSDGVDENDYDGK